MRPPSRLNARIAVIREGEQIVTGDTAAEPDHVRYQVLCRRNYRSGTITP